MRSGWTADGRRTDENSSLYELNLEYLGMPESLNHLEWLLIQGPLACYLLYICYLGTKLELYMYMCMYGNTHKYSLLEIKEKVTGHGHL